MSKVNYFICVMFMLMICIWLNGQPVTWDWAVRAGGISYDYCEAMCTDNEDNIYVTGSLCDNSSFGSIELTIDDGEMYVAKFNNGNWIWVQQFTADQCNAIATDSNLNTYITGSFVGSAAFGSNYLYESGVHSNVFVAKLDLNGNWVWAISVGDIWEDSGRCIAIGSNGDVYVAGKFKLTATFGNISLNCSSAESDIFIAKLDSSGNWLWAKKIGGPNNETCNSIAVDSNDNIYLTGNFNGTATFGSNSISSSENSSDIYVAKISNIGDWIWARQAGWANNEYSGGLAVDNDDNIIIGGYYFGDTYIGSNWLTMAGNEDIFVAKLDNTGNWLWAKQSGGGELKDVIMSI